MPGTFAVTAQSPSDTRVVVRCRTILILCRSSSLLTAPPNVYWYALGVTELATARNTVAERGKRCVQEEAYQ